MIYAFLGYNIYIQHYTTPDVLEVMTHQFCLKKYRLHSSGDALRVLQDLIVKICRGPILPGLTRTHFWLVDIPVIGG